MDVQRPIRTMSHKLTHRQQANKITFLHLMINGQGGDLANMTDTELWVVSQQAGALGSMTPFPCCPSTSEWWGRTAVPRSWALQTWTEMANYGIDTSAMLTEPQTEPAKPREHDRHVIGCCPPERGQEVFKWSARIR